MPCDCVSWLTYPPGDEQVLIPCHVEQVSVSASAGVHAGERSRDSDEVAHGQALIATTFEMPPQM